MQTATQAARQRKAGGRRLPQPWRDADELKVHLRRGQLSMLVAAPGVGKSVLANAFAVDAKVPTLYLSMDTDPFTTSVRLVAMKSGKTMDEAESGLINGEKWAIDWLSTIRNVKFAFPSSPEDAEISARMLAYLEARGAYPELLVIDNLSNITVGDDEFGGMRRVMRDLQSAAGATQTAILVLHHAVGEHEDGDAPVPMRGTLGKLSKYPALILTAHRSGFSRLGVSVVKNRFGPADPAGHQVMFYLRADMERAQVADEARGTMI